MSSTCPTCGAICTGWWELLHVHRCRPVDGDSEEYDDDTEADFGYYGGLNNDWLLPVGR